MADMLMNNQMSAFLALKPSLKMRNNKKAIIFINLLFLIIFHMILSAES